MEFEYHWITFGVPLKFRSVLFFLIIQKEVPWHYLFQEEQSVNTMWDESKWRINWGQK